MSIFKSALTACFCLSLAACAGAPMRGAVSLSTADNLVPAKTGRTTTLEYRDGAALGAVRRVYLNPTQLVMAQDARYPLTGAERALVLTEVEAQLCFELSERYDIVRDAAQSDAQVFSSITWFEPTGKAGSGAAAVVNAFIPGPVGLRLPGSLGGLGAEAEMKVADRQVAAIVWARQAQALGTDSPSLSAMGDALQFAEPFGDDTARVMSPEPLPEPRSRGAGVDPCAHYGGRINETGFIIDSVTGLYVPASRPAAVEAEPKSE